jgi:hypothetical protein
MPPSNRIATSATVTIRWSVMMEREPRSGNRSALTDAATRKSAGLGTCTHSVIRLDPTARSSATAARLITTANTSTSCIAALLVGSGVDRTTPTRLPGTPWRPP